MLFEEVVAGLAAAAVAGTALDGAVVQAAAAAQGAASAALAAELAVPVLGPGLPPEGVQQSVMADQCSVQAEEAADTAIGQADFAQPDRSEVLAAYMQLQAGAWLLALRPQGCQ